MAGKVSTDPNIFLLPDIGEGLQEAELIKWLVAEGDTVEENQTIAEVETDKALSEIPSPRAGVIAKLHGGPGDMMQVGEPFVTYKGEGGKGAKGSEGGAKGASGDVRVGIPSGLPVWTDLSTVSGSIRSSLEGAGQPAEGQDHVELRAKTVSGDIVLTQI